MVEKLISKRVILRLAPNLVIHATDSGAFCPENPVTARIKYRNTSFRVSARLAPHRHRCAPASP
jgi:hypothetical protein